MHYVRFIVYLSYGDLVNVWWNHLLLTIKESEKIWSYSHAFWRQKGAAQNYSVLLNKSHFCRKHFCLKMFRPMFSKYFPHILDAIWSAFALRFNNNCHQQIHFKTMKGTSIWYLPKPGSLALNIYSSKSDMIKVKKLSAFWLSQLVLWICYLALYILSFSVTLCCLR